MKEGIPPRIEIQVSELGSPIAIEDLDEAREYIQELVRDGVRPIITVPLDYAEDVRRFGIHSVPHQDHKSRTNYSFIAGTIGQDPFIPQNEKREVFEIDPVGLGIQPRRTGADDAFHGVVGFPKGVPSRALHSKGVFSSESWKQMRAADNENGPLHEGEARA